MCNNNNNNINYKLNNSVFSHLHSVIRDELRKKHICILNDEIQLNDTKLCQN